MKLQLNSPTMWASASSRSSHGKCQLGVSRSSGLIPASIHFIRMRLAHLRHGSSQLSAVVW
jgi:hypothetical protein